MAHMHVYIVLHLPPRVRVAIASSVRGFVWFAPELVYSQ
ncbi:hypothetical protein ACP70R_011174 [Stipagrostis hirtigluma subsp. patula]